MLPAKVELCDPEDIAQQLAYLHKKLKARFRHIDEHLLDGSIEDAVLRYLHCPECFDASRGVPLSYYLELWARSYLDKQLRKENRHRKQEMSSSVSDIFFEKIVSGAGAGRGIYSGKDTNEEEDEEQEVKIEWERKVLDTIVKNLTPCDRFGVRLLRAGSSREKWVRHLKIEGLPREKQQRKIDAEKDRLRKKLRRWVQKTAGGVNFGTGWGSGQTVLTRVESANHG